MIRENEMKMKKHEWRKEEKQFYLPSTEPEKIKVPSFNYFTIHGQGNPNDKFFGEYIGVLYSLSYAVKMSPKAGMAPGTYFDYTVYPLEGVWDISDEAKKQNSKLLDKNSLIFDLMIRQPDFVTEQFAQEIIERTKIKKPHPLLEQVRFEPIEDGWCVQMLHKGSYDDEPRSFALMDDFCRVNSLNRTSMPHREIYLSDARKVEKEKLKTVLRYTILEVGSEKKQLI
jgi:hypothetical protein